MISTTAEYALRSVIYLASRKAQVATRSEIAEATQVPVEYLLKVLLGLDKAGLVQSKRGPGGGYRLNRDPSGFTVLDVVQAVSSVPRIDSCPLGLECHVELCPLHRLLDDAGRKIEEAFAKVTIKDLAKTNRNHRSCVFPPITASLKG